MNKLVAVLMILSPILLTREGFSAQKVARIECPAEAKAKIVVSDKIGEDPTFSRQGPDLWWSSLSRHGSDRKRISAVRVQERHCFVTNLTNTQRSGRFDLPKVTARVIDCDLEFLVQLEAPTMRKWFVIVSTVSFLVSGSTTQGVDYVVKRIVCPSSIPMRIDWVKHIGSDPTFSEVQWNGQLPEARLRKMHQNGQAIICDYHVKLGGDALLTEPAYGYYSYTAKRKILECQKINEAYGLQTGS